MYDIRLVDYTLPVEKRCYLKVCGTRRGVNALEIKFSLLFNSLKKFLLFSWTKEMKATVTIF